MSGVGGVMSENIIEIMNTDVIIETDTPTYDLMIENLIVTDYTHCLNLPKINSVTVLGDKSSDEYGLASLEDISLKENIANKVVAINESSTDVQYPSAKCVYDELQGKVNTDLSDLSAVGEKALDGQWVAIPYSNTSDAIVYSQTAPTADLTKSLAGMLPNDDYYYEVIFTGAVSTGATSGNQTRLALSSSILEDAANIYLVSAQTRSSSAVTAYGTGIMPVGNDKEITIKSYANNTGAISLYAVAYRRIGTNS